jgi:hypothetical protein
MKGEEQVGKQAAREKTEAVEERAQTVEERGEVRIASACIPCAAR